MKHLIATILMVFAFFSFSNAESQQTARNNIEHALITTLYMNGSCFIEELKSNDKLIKCFLNDIDKDWTKYDSNVLIYLNNITNEIEINIYHIRISERDPLIVRTSTTTCEIANSKSSDYAKCKYDTDFALYDNITIDKSYITSFVNKAKSIAKKTK